METVRFDNLNDLQSALERLAPGDCVELDSLDLVDMIVGLQQKFGIMLRDNKDIRNVRTLGDVYNLFEKLVAEHPEIADKIK